MLQAEIGVGTEQSREEKARNMAADPMSESPALQPTSPTRPATKPVVATKVRAPTRAPFFLTASDLRESIVAVPDTKAEGR
jgi:hypothetical protein